MKISIRQYYMGFVSLYGIAAVVPFVSPLLHACISDSNTVAEYLYPPLGDFQQLAFTATVGSLLLTSFVVFACCQSARKVHPSIPAILMVGFLIGTCILGALYVRYVRRVPVPSMGLEVPVSIGYQRTDFALQWYPHSSDWEMLHDRGPYEAQIQVLWTQHSIRVVRGLLWLFYTLTLICWLSVVCLAVYQHASEEAPSESEHPKPASP
jgi:hypothetical protein